MPGPEAFPWRSLMAFGLGRLGLSCNVFWATTPRELAAAAEGLFGPFQGAPGRSDLEALMARYPDRRSRHADDDR